MNRDEELQSALTTYINSLGQVSKSHSTVPFSQPLGATKQDGELDQFLHVHIDTKQIIDLH